MAKIRLDIIGDAASAERAFARASRSARGFEQQTSKTSRAFGAASTVMRGAAIGLAGALGTGLVVAAKRGWDELAESQKVSAQTEAALKSTGGAASVTQKQIEDLALALSRMSGVDDEAIQASENVLLAFTNVRNEAGKGPKVFDEATKAVLDWSVRTGKDATAAAQTLGRALDDPVKGLARLARAGVTFTDAEKERIKAMVDAGNVAEAQVAILQKMEDRFGGAAKAAGETLPGQLAKLKNAFDESMGHLMEALLPHLTDLVNAIVDNLPKIEAAFGAMRDGIAAALDTLGPILDTFKQQLHGWVTLIDGLIHGDFSKIWDGLKDIVGGAINRAIETVKLAWEGMSTAATALGQKAFDGLKAAMSPLAGWVRDRVAEALGFVTGKVEAALAAGTSFGHNLLEGLKAGIAGFADWVSGRVAAAVGAVRDAVDDALGAATRFGHAIYDGLVAGVTGFVSFIEGRIIAARSALTGAAKAVGAAAQALGEAVYNGFTAGIGAVFGYIDSLIGKLEGLKSLAEAVASAVSSALGGVSGVDWSQVTGKAAGGPVRAGTAYLVGEAGPELFVPGSSGSIVPNGVAGAAAGGGGTVVHVHVAGSLVAERDLTDTIVRALRQRRKGSGPLGLD